MSLAWLEEESDYGESEEILDTWDDDLDYDTIRHPAQAAFVEHLAPCRWVTEWAPMRGPDVWVSWSESAQLETERDEELLTSWVRSVDYSLDRSRADVDRLHEHLSLLATAIDALDAEPMPPAAEFGSITVKLQSYAERLQRLRNVLERRSDDPDPDAGAVVVNWRELNRRQAREGWATPIESEEGSPISTYRIRSFDVSALEVDDD